MRVLIDECMPHKFKLCLRPHACQTVPEAGWAGKTNGELISLAEGQFDVLVTLDKGLEFQQNLAGRKIAILLIRSKSNRMAELQQHASACLAAIESIQPGSCSGLDNFSYDISRTDSCSFVEIRGYSRSRLLDRFTFFVLIRG